MRARVLVVGLDHVAEQHRRAAICVPELECVVDADLALPREDLEQQDERQHDQHRPDAIGRGDRHDESDRGEGGVDEERDPHRSRVLDERDAEGCLRPNRPGCVVGDELGCECREIEGDVAPRRRYRPREAEDEHRSNGVPSVGDG